MKTRTLIFSLASILLLALTTCKKDPQPIMERFDLSREDFTVGTTSASIVGTYAYSGTIDEITVCVSEDGVHPATFSADINGKNFAVEMTGLRPATSYQYYYSIDYGFSKPFTTEAKSFTTLSESPTVRTIDVMSIDSTTVRVNCETVSDGGMEITERGVCWNTYGNPNLDDESLTYTSAGLGQYSCRISGLTLSTKYYVRAYAKNASGIGFGEELEFETLAEARLPEVSTVEVSNVTSTTATCMGNVASDGGLELTERGVCWSLSPNPTLTGSHAAASDVSLGVFEVSMTGLTPNKTYHVRAYATNAKGTAYGDDLTFTTTEGLPVVTTSGITEITATSAKGGGEVTDQGASNVTERGICWGTSHNPTTSGTHGNSGTGMGNYTVSMTNLTPNATYYVRAYATNSQGTAYGAEVSFTALEGLPVVLTLDMTDITSTTAKGHGKVTDQGGSAVTERGICWSTSPSPTTNGSHANNGTGTGEYTVSITNLTPGTKYYVRAYATNSQGTTYGEQKDFTTAATLPTVVTGDISGTTAYGEVTDAGGATVTERGICWSTSHNPTTSGSHANSGTGTGTFTVNMTGLTPNTTYYVRAYAINSAGTSYGSEVSFTTQQAQTYTISVSANPSNGGTVSGGGTYQQGQNCAVRAVPNTDFIFKSWTENGYVVSTNSSYSFTVTGNRDLKANFKHRYYIDVSANPSNGGVVTGGGSFEQGEHCTVSATANTGFEFANWTENGFIVSTEADYTFTLTQNRVLVANFNYNGGGGNAPTGAINGLFSVNPAQQVYFSQGNLQYIGSAAVPYWKFADYQWEFFGDNGQMQQGEYLNRDLFGWGTSGWNSGNTYYRPWDTEYSNGSLYGPPGEYNLTGSYANADWGVYNPISNGGNQSNQWRTLTWLEWCYVFSTRTTTSGIRYAKANVNNVNGVILLPDDWSSDTYSLSNTNSNGASYGSNTISATQWDTLEQAGAVFLPAAGFRSGTTVGYVGSGGDYSSASYLHNNSVYLVSFLDSNLYPQSNGNRCNGFSVRLVQDL